MKGNSTFSARVLRGIISCVVMSAVLIPLFVADMAWPTSARNHLERFAVMETGAKNLVSAIYLGYRAFDTLGETIVLLVAISGTIALIGYSSAPSQNDNHGKSGSYIRTDLLEVVTGKLGPVVLLFGLYVMLFGHLSPGGGFQGGVVVASGLIFMVLGSNRAVNRFTPSLHSLLRIEAVTFALLLISSLFGVWIGTGIFGRLPAGFPVPEEAFIILLNILIGLKVGAGIALMCLSMLRSDKP